MTVADRPTYAALRDALDATWGGIGTVLMFAGDSYCAEAVMDRGPKVTEALLELARQNDRVRRVLETFATGSAWSGVAMAGLGVAVPIAAHHGLVPEELARMMGAPPIEEPDGDAAADDQHPEVVLG